MRMYFFRRGLRGLGVAPIYDLHQIMADIDVRIGFELLKVKVSLIFFGTDFLAQRGFRYAGRDVSCYLTHLSAVLSFYRIQSISLRA
jgi:hypothetical protein